MGLEEQFQRAVEDGSFRQEFLDNITEKGLPEYIGHIFYNPAELGEIGEMMEAKPHFLAQLLVKGTKSDIMVYGISFSSKEHRTLDEFLCSLEDHEYYHAKEIYENPKSIIIPLWNKLKPVMFLNVLFSSDFDKFLNRIDEFKRQFEIRTYVNQINASNNRNCSEEYKMGLIKKLMSYMPNDVEIKVLYSEPKIEKCD
jgi:hypothetical protein